MSAIFAGRNRKKTALTKVNFSLGLKRFKKASQGCFRIVEKIWRDLRLFCPEELTGGQF